jgi:putative (di)nucleoside polyphosphate hydrolase
MMLSPHNLPYRSGVGLCLFNHDGLVLCAERRDYPGAWQMPQGGVKKDEELRTAALRELKEEIGTDNAVIIGAVPDKLRYEFPDYLQYRHGVFRGKYRGQEQTWFALLFQGHDGDINLTGEFEPEKPEFVAWRWMPLEETPALIVNFKRPVYEHVVSAFGPLADAIRQGEILFHQALFKPLYPGRRFVAGKAGQDFRAVTPLESQQSGLFSQIGKVIVWAIVAKGSKQRRQFTGIARTVVLLIRLRPRSQPFLRQILPWKQFARILFARGGYVRMRQQGHARIHAVSAEDAVQELFQRRYLSRGK